MIEWASVINWAKGFMVNTSLLYKISHHFSDFFRLFQEILCDQTMILKLVSGKGRKFAKLNKALGHTVVKYCLNGCAKPYTKF